MRIKTGIFKIALILLLGNPGSVSATLMSIETIYNSPGGGDITVTGVYDNAGFTGVGQEIFHFSEAKFEFSANAGIFLFDTSHHVFDRFGIAFIDGNPVDLVNHNNTDVNGKSLLIFQNAANDQGFGIYMSDNSSDLDVEGWWITNHQGAEGHNLNRFNGPFPVVPAPEPDSWVILLVGLFILLLMNPNKKFGVKVRNLYLTST